MDLVLLACEDAYIIVDLAHHEIFFAKVGKCGLTFVTGELLVSSYFSRIVKSNLKLTQKRVTAMLSSLLVKTYTHVYSVV